MKNRKLKVGFYLDLSREWMGGVNYFYNLFLSLKINKASRICPVWFHTKRTNKQIVKKFDNIVEKHNLLVFDRGKNGIRRHLRRVSKVYEKILFRLYKIKVLSHSRKFYFNKIKTIEWIPDLQHIHYPEFFSQKEYEDRKKFIKRCVESSNLILCSSEAAKNDLISIHPHAISKVKVLHFVSYIPSYMYNVNRSVDLEKRLKFKKFFYLPNQFWVHKNHITVFKALKIVKDKNIDIKIVCTGFFDDYRNKTYYKDLTKTIEDFGITENVSILGLVQQSDVHYLMRNCVAILNPSLFEGWSTTVEEAKSIGKNMILSKIPVHVEQNPPDSVFFDPNNEIELAEVMLQEWKRRKEGPNIHLESRAKSEQKQRLSDFGKTFEKYVLELM